MDIENGLMPLRNPWLLSSISRLFSSQMAFRWTSSYTKTVNTSKKSESERFLSGWSWSYSNCRVSGVSPFHRSWCRCCFSRSPTQTQAAPLSPVTPHEAGPTAACRTARPSATSRWPAELQGQQPHQHTFHTLEPPQVLLPVVLDTFLGF